MTDVELDQYRTSLRRSSNNPRLMICLRNLLLTVATLSAPGYNAGAQSIPLPKFEHYFRPVFQIPKEYINDHCLIHAKGIWHLYYIKGIITGSWGYPGNEVAIGHATSANLLDWEPQADALRIGPPGSSDGAHVYAPSVIERQEKYYMFYTGNAKSFESGEHIFLATSTDLFTGHDIHPTR
jgi:sucrose-6-phosphate hydrolase SacC (GH32 family)